ncbi:MULTISPECIES: head GIN domain-containing protein [unclassified Roseivirga]|uniref:head GIN domain-containing protein n=1 Tax=unclassified Roseivirga TaxID=2626142 RepID=UPI00257BE580|nr:MULTISPECIES: head GIN domain-containing protein [unclassified Roseivirga]MEC7753102.1 head GIN domain-containing protein [Bacteroidota bacterium]
MNNFVSKRLLTLSIAAVFIIAGQALLGQTRQKREVKNFNALSVSSAFEVEISVGNQESLEIEAEDRFIDDIVTEVRGGTLIIKIQDSRETRRMRQSPKAYLTVKSLERINVSGAVTLKTRDVLKGKKLDLELSGASVLNIEMQVEALYLEASGACVINLEGEAREQVIKTSGATVYRAYDLESVNADIRVSGAGSAHVYATGRLEVHASGASSVRYRGGASVSADSSGASSIRKG